MKNMSIGRGLNDKRSEASSYLKIERYGIHLLPEKHGPTLAGWRDEMTAETELPQDASPRQLIYQIFH